MALGQCHSPLNLNSLVSLSCKESPASPAGPGLWSAVSACGAFLACYIRLWGGEKKGAWAGTAGTGGEVGHRAWGSAGRGGIGFQSAVTQARAAAGIPRSRLSAAFVPRAKWSWGPAAAP